MAHKIPSFESLPLKKDGPRGNAWGRFGEGNELGMLNLLTPDTVKRALEEVEHGIRINTDWPLNALEKPAFQRQGFHQHIFHKAPRTINDDILTFNTQSSTQWDGFRHFGYQDHKLFYNGTTEEEILGSLKIGTQVIVENGGIVGRGVLIDYYNWAQSQGIELSCLEYHAVTVPDLLKVAEAQNVTFLQGDIVFIRTGYMKAISALPAEELGAFTTKLVPTGIGMESSERTLKWIWETGFAAVASDALAFEALPFGSTTHWMHEWLLAGWGMPIGELFDLEKLAAECKRLQKWSFFFSSMPLHVPGGVASPPNGVAIL